MSIATSSTAIEVLKILGLSTDRCISARIDFEPDEFPTVTVKYFAERDALIKVAKLLASNKVDA